MSAIINADGRNVIGERDRLGRTARRPAERSTREPVSANGVPVDGNAFGETRKTAGETPALRIPKTNNQFIKPVQDSALQFLSAGSRIRRITAVGTVTSLASDR